MNAEVLKEKTVKDLKAICKDMGLSNYSKLKEDELIELILSNKETEEDSSKEEELIKLHAKRKVVSITKGVVLGKFELTPAEYEKDTKIQYFVKIGFVEKA